MFFYFSDLVKKEQSSIYKEHRWLIQPYHLITAFLNLHHILIYLQVKVKRLKLRGLTKSWQISVPNLKVGEQS